MHVLECRTAVSAAFLASLVEVVEAFTIILAVGTVRGWRPAITGTFAALIALFVIVASLGPTLDQVPLQWMQIAIGILLLLFGLRWLRKAILRYAGIIPLHDESAAFAAAKTELGGDALRSRRQLNWIAGIPAFKAVLIEGVEVVFIVVAVGAGHGLLWQASIGAVAAGAVVLAVGFVAHRPLARVPENALKFVVGILLSSFGVFWTGEGAGVVWPGSDFALFGFILVFLIASLLSVRIIRSRVPEVIA
jgi:Ca2+/H+ antiporter, TMEM165/GDT1 family